MGYHDGAENLVFDEMLRWDPDAKLPNNNLTKMLKTITAMKSKETTTAINQQLP